MTDYVKSTNFASKDSLSTGNPLKIVKGTEIDTEFNNIATAVATKADLNSPTLVTPNLGIPSAVNLANATNLSLTTGVTGTLPVANGGTGATTASAARTSLGLVIGTNVQAWDADLDTWATKTAPTGIVVGTTDTQTLTNKTLTSPTINTPTMGGSVLTSGSVQSPTSGTVVDFTGIPSWAKRITLLMNNVSVNTSSTVYLVQVGSGSFSTSGYVVQADLSGSASGVYTNGIYAGYNAGSSSYIISTTLVLCLLGSNTWVVAGTGGLMNVTSTGWQINGSTPSLSGALDRIRLTTYNGTATFTAGSINILYE